MSLPWRHGVHRAKRASRRRVSDAASCPRYPSPRPRPATHLVLKDLVNDVTVTEDGEPIGHERLVECATGERRLVAKASGDGRRDGLEPLRLVQARREDGVAHRTRASHEDAAVAPGLRYDPLHRVVAVLTAVAPKLVRVVARAARAALVLSTRCRSRARIGPLGRPVVRSTCDQPWGAPACAWGDRPGTQRRSRGRSTSWRCRRTWRCRTACARGRYQRRQCRRARCRRTTA